MTALSYRTVDIDGYEIFYREAGDPARPALLLHSFPSPDGTALDSWYLQRPEVDEIQLDLFGDYASNVALYPAFQAYFREHQPRVLAVWGKNDPFFLPPGAGAYKRDLPETEEQRSTPYDRLPLTGSPANRLKHQ